MTGRTGRRSWGYIRKRKYPASGRVVYECSYVGPDLATHYCPTGAWSQKIDAEAWLAREHRLVELHNLGERQWTPPKSRAVKPVRLDEYAEKWNRERKLSDRTRVEYERYRTKHLGALGKVVVGNFTSEAVRTWWAGLDGKYERRNAQVYAWVHAVVATAVQDELIATNPVNIRGAMTSAKTKREPVVLTVNEVARLAEAMDERYLLMVLIMAWCTCRYGEASALQRRDIEGPILHVRAGVVRVNGQYVRKSTKTGEARKVAIPPHVLPEVERHLREHVGPEPEALLFPSERTGTYVHDQVFRESYFDAAAEQIGQPRLVPHDLRKFAATQTAATGATLREAMNRLGHSTVRAAMIYQQAVSGRDAKIAVELSKRTGWTPPEQ